jgi:addiction module HigA family antidote
MDPVSPGELLWEEFMMPMGLTLYRIAKEIGVPPQRIGDIVSGKRSIPTDSDLRPCTFFGLTADKIHGELARITLWQREVA